MDVDALVALHDEAVGGWHHDEAAASRRLEGPAPDPGSESSELWRVIGREHLVNIRLWHEEDQARRRDVDDATIAAVKRRIDGLNQARNDLVERIDEEILAAVGPAPDGVPLHSETPGAMIDRLSILALKVYHMGEESERADADEAHRAACRARRGVLEEQRADLAACLAELLDDLVAGRRRVRLYRQFKMYNDPATNPALRGEGR